MRTEAITLLVATSLLTACKRPSDSAEVQRLGEEVERLKSAQASPPPAATPALESPDFQNFLRVARRLMTAIESGISFQDFHERVTDVIASAKEASRSAPPNKQKAIATFAIAISDAHDIWRYQMANSKFRLRYSKEFGAPVIVDDPCSNRWDYKLPELVSAYKLDKSEPGYPQAYSDKDYYTTVSIEFTIKKIFKVCGETFETLESAQ